MKDEKINKLKENLKLKKELKKIGICSFIGPTGPKGEKGDPGPVGPKGDNGPTTIEIGKTETGEPDTESIVTNIGTNKNVILNFKIPKGSPGEKGEKGDTGPIGPRGLPGEIGRSEVITVDKTETIEPDEPAEVQDDLDGNIHYLTFYIPKGEKGETGPAGPMGLKGEPNGLGAYGERYSNTNQGFNITANTETIIPLEQTGPAIFVDYDSSYAIEIKKYGVYQINYFLNVATSTDTNYIVSVKVAGIKAAGSDIKGEGKANTINRVFGSVLYSLVEGDEVTLTITAEQNTELIFDGTTTAKLSVIKLD